MLYLEIYLFNKANMLSFFEYGALFTYLLFELWGAVHFGAGCGIVTNRIARLPERQHYTATLAAWTELFSGCYR
ncbi:hypothetical protein QUF31_20405 [Dickeya chrysanthemi]|uniref:hypothetical protein n=1 Tax=Dickeya chrysanthemi TaxID=556 RepID=UPI00031B6756|nr:hypothetical protein [Dickeya chrysanthemi]WJM85406.1 hypothetical protein QUF31_20405 [Dickeya chrysanthemi]